MPQICLNFHDLTLGYNSHAAVHHLEGAVRKGSLTAVVGANGSGKSTLMKGIVGVLKPMAGSIAKAPDARIAYLPQQSELDRSFPARVIDLVSLGLWPRRGLLGRHTAEDRNTVAAALAAVGLADFEKRPLDTLSGGQLQRTLFARVLVQDANIILLDEPFNAIDTRTIGDLIALIKRWHGEERTVMVVVHDLDLVRRHFPETLLLARQKVAWGETEKALQPENLLRARRFHEAWEENAPWCEPDGHDDHGHHDHDREHHHGAGPRAA
jgi:zinc/manganese transport system ATP-binding protein